MNADIDISNVVLTTPRLVLRPWRMNDVDDMYEYASVDGVGQPAGWAPHTSREESERIVSLFIEGKKTFAIELNGKVVGSVGIDRYDEKRFPAFDALRAREIGYVLAKPCWGMGLMTEAVARVLEYLFVDLSLDAVFCGYFLFNRRSARVQEKNGFTPIDRGRIRTALGTVEDEAMLVITRETYLARRGK